MRQSSIKPLKTALTLPLLGMLACGGAAYAATTTSGLSLAQSPLYVTSTVSPIVLLSVTKDHQLYYKAYNDYTDLDGNGTMDTTYTHSFNYFGYFDHGKCYQYDATNNYFYPVSVTSTKYCTAGSNQWSGNFLNWVSMSRIDVLRKVLYGGTRSTDTADTTVLERAFLPTDAHAWVKFYNGSDLNQLTPFNSTTAPSTAATATGTTGQALPLTAETDVTFSSVTTGSSGLDVQVGDQVTAVSPSGTRTMKGLVKSFTANSVVVRVPVASASGSSGSETGNWALTNHTRVGVSFCNVTYAYNVVSQNVSTSASPPLIRVVRGDYSLWTSNERTQCLYDSERGDTNGEGKNNGNRVGLSGLSASAKNPPTSRGLFSVMSSTKPDYTARVKVCVAGLIGNESCRRYDANNSNNLKPIGVLQEYGEGTSPAMRFALVTGSYEKNISGGVLRRNAMATLSKPSYADNEIDPTNGTYTSNVGIIRTLDRLRMYGYQFYGGDSVADGYMSTDNCDYQQMGMVLSGGGGSGSPANQGNCSSWGNPIGEIYLEGLRYLAGKTTPTAAFLTSNGSGKDYNLGLPRPAWVDPLTADTYCTPLNTLVVNSSSATFDDDQYDGVVDIGSSTSDLNTKTDTIGTDEGISGQEAIIGNNGTTEDGLCTAKTVSNFSSLEGICPEAPSLQGTYKIAGLAYRARTNRIRSDLTVPATDTKSLKVSTYGVQLASSTPVIKLTVNGSPVVITPAYRLERDGRSGTGTLVDFRPIGTPTNASGSFYLAWEDSSQGGDYDQDVWGLLSYTVSGSTVKVRTVVIAAATANPQGFGYTIEGTNNDGLHFYSGILGFNYTDPRNILSSLKFDNNTTPVAGTDRVNSSGGCRDCQAGAPAITAEFQVASSASSTVVLKEPLYYAAKWGGFVNESTTETVTDKPNLTSEWDASNNLTGAAGADGLPDKYFYVINPTQLQDALRRAFLAILAEGSSAGLAANSYSLNGDNVIYQAGFNTKVWTGWLKAVPLTTTGDFASSGGWNTDTSFTIDPPNRRVYTYGTDGIPFRWANLTAAQQTTLNGSDSLGSARVDYLRGATTNEGTVFRQRQAPRLGDIVNSSPMYVGVPTGQYDFPLSQFNQVYVNDSSYPAWRASKASRTKMLYVGANDGMLHGFNATNGTEVFAYVPNAVFNKLPGLTSISYTHQYTVDGSPNAADVKFAGGFGVTAGWHTVLVGGLGAGGRGVYALDVTEPTDYQNEANAATNVLWEFTSSNDNDLGYTLSKPLILKMNNGKWAAVFGNGYFQNGDTVTTGRAKLFILYIEEGSNGWTAGDYMVIDTATGTTSAPNGIGNVVAFDDNLDGLVDYVYGGDLYGRMWRFDVTSANTNQWRADALVQVCANPTNATNCNASLLPITQRPTVTFHPTSSTGRMVYFGTGKYLEQSDQGDATKGWMFGVWDSGTSLGLLSSLTSGQQIVQTISTLASGNRDVTALTEDWASHKLWREQLPVAGERLAGVPRLSNGILLYTTYIPSSQTCSQEGSSYLMAVRYQNGGKANYAVFDTNGDGLINDSDSIVGGIKVDPTLGGITLIKPGIAGDDVTRSYSSKVGSSSSGAGNTAGSSIGSNDLRTQGTQSRVSWRELFRE